MGQRQGGAGMGWNVSNRLSGKTLRYTISAYPYTIEVISTDGSTKYIDLKNCRNRSGFVMRTLRL